MTEVAYPARLSSEAMVSVPGVMIIPPFGGAMPVPFCRKAWVPVSREKRVGVQVEAEQYPLVNRRPSAARRSMFGVRTAVAPLHDTSP